MSKMQETISDWQELDRKKKIFLVVLALAGVTFIAVHHFANEKNTSSDASIPVSADASGNAIPQSDGLNGQAHHFDVLPKTNRNQGLEDLTTRLDQMEALIQRRYGEPAEIKSPPAAQPNASASVNLDAPIEPGKVDFNEAPKLQNGAQSFSKDMIEPSGGMKAPAPAPAPAEMKVWVSVNKPAATSKASVVPTITIPVNSGLDAVMLSGINARQPGTTTGAAGSSTSALNVGAPFVTRLKGDAILPNGWKLSQLGDCFLGGSAVAILSTERANAIADTISCISANGEVWEAPVKAYALDVDGTLGIAGKVVSKQGSILMQSALTGMASGLGSALSPTGLNSYNSQAVSGQTQGYQLPNLGLVAGSAVGQGVNTAAAQLSRFYLEFAREIFPVVEVVAGTRVTWILKESIELKKSNTLKVTSK